MNTFWAFPEKTVIKILKFWVHFVANIGKMRIEIIRRNVTSNMRVFIFTRHQSFYFRPHFLWVVSAKCINIIKNCGVKRPRTWTFCPKPWWAFCPEGIFFFLNKYTNSNTYQWNEIDVKLRKAVLSNVKIIANSGINFQKTNDYIRSMPLKLNETAC